MTTTSNQTAQTPLYDLILQQNARMTEFAGWEMPVQFSGLKPEHAAVREAVGMFDISHMGKFLLSGEHLREQLQRLVPSDLSRLSAGESQYTVLLNPQGGIIDDFIFYYQGNNRAVAIVNAATTDKDKTWLLEQLKETSVQLHDVSQEQILLAVQGPKAITTLDPLLEGDMTSLKAFGHTEVSVFGETAFISRTGYTGEDGVEIMLPIAAGRKLWEALLEKGVTPCGLGARDTLRLESALSLYSQDIDDTTTPLEAGLGWLVHLDSKGDFIGREVLAKQKAEGLQRRLVGLEMQGRGIARHDYPILQEGKEVGIVTSGTLSPTLGKAIALGYVPKSLAKVGQALEVEIRGKKYPAQVVKKPFYRTSHPAPKG
ncbi:aminomethyltransferase [Halothece sp. PCC 7418]|uniref:glycine cleavage system aminomethyltransferase GcvT n=1 Tax=Halothece sp. (strain PCC 7418) TaxID=65093 RepID=UPI0002A08D24|nr:glycine cleavage system aminomethyltransferase GcvT [Halothece sp. PCC 7418]AFZ42605.1 aminomethyltransferase [Halothece sp. PCC 7418]